MHYKCWFWNRLPNIKEAISRSNIGQFSKLRTFLKSEFCGLRKDDQDFYPRCFGSREMAKNKVSKVIVDTLYIQGVPRNLTHFVFGLLWIVRLSNFPMRPFILKLMYWGQKLVLIVFWDINRTRDIIKTNSRSKLFKIIRKDPYQVLLRVCVFQC